MKLCNLWCRIVLCFCCLIGSLSGLCRAESPSPPGFDSNTFAPFYFVQSSDLHILNTNTATDLINLGLDAQFAGVPLIVATGDLYDHSSASARNIYLNAVAGLPVPYRALPGNHDVDATLTPALYRATLGSDYYSLVYNNCALVCLDTITLRDAVTYPDEYDAQWTWLEQTLAAARAAHRTQIILLMHHPPFVNSEYEADSFWNFPSLERARLLDLARTYGVSSLFAGHLHADLQSPQANPPLYIAPSLNYNLDGISKTGYRVIRVLSNRVEEYPIFLEDPYDATPPAPPGVPAVAGRSGDSVTLEWLKPADNVGVLRYEIQRDGALCGSAVEERFTDHGLTPGGPAHRYTVTAFDFAGNASAPSAPLTVATQASGLTDLVPQRALWSYLDGGIVPTTDWNQPDYADPRWSWGRAVLGFGGGEATPLKTGADPWSKPITTYFRRTFEVADPAAVKLPVLNLWCGAGAVVYLNGAEVGRWNMPDGPLHTASLAARDLTPAERAAWHEIPINPAQLQAGTNLLAVEVHLASPAQSSLAFDMALFHTAALPQPVSLVRAPYLQDVSPNSVSVRWRTGVPAIGRLTCARQIGAAETQATTFTASLDHEFRLYGLQPGTQYYYSIGTGAQTLDGGDDTCTFVTPPPDGTEKFTRIWVLGDSGTGDANERAVRDAYASYSGSLPTDLILMLGDNAYTLGQDSEYQKAVFDMFSTTLSSVPLWSTLGNHDAYSTLPGTTIHPYYDVFSFPQRAEAGGIPSGTEAYYSFNYANIHFICLDSMESDRSPAGPMLTWLKRDLAANRAEWTIAFFHHAPYSKGGHDSDNPGNEGFKQIEMRQNALPILEAGGTDLVLTGHSHSYERSYLLNGHYGLSNTLTSAMILDHGDGSGRAGNGIYTKPGLRTPNSGTVYAVCGCSSSLVSGPLNHPANVHSFLTYGSMAISVMGRRLQARFIDTSGDVLDDFTIVKTGPTVLRAKDWQSYR